MRAKSRLACTLALSLSGCLTRTAVGSLSEDAAVDAVADVIVEVDPLDELRKGMIGRFCGSSTGVTALENIEIEFFTTTYTVQCDCSMPFPGQFMLNGDTGEYFVSELSLDGQGFGRAKDPPVFAGWEPIYLLKHISLQGDELSMQRVLDDTTDSFRIPSNPVMLELQRCPGGDCSRVAGCKPSEANGD